MSLLCDRPIVHVDIDVDPYNTNNNNNNGNNGNNGVRQGKRKEVEQQVMMRSNPRSRFYIQHQDELDEQVEEEEIGSDRSSIGVDSNCTSSLTSSAGEQEQEEEEEEVNSKLQSVKGGGLGLGSFDSLEESLPIKKGLSKFFSGKSKSFTTLSSVINSSASTSDLAKAENPFNKRRRILLTCNRRRSRASYSSFVTSLPPLLSPQHEQQLVDEDIDSDDDDDGDDGDDGLEKLEGKPKPNPKPPAAALLVSGMMKVTSSKHNNGFMISPTRSFSLSDLQPHHHHHHHHHHV